MRRCAAAGLRRSFVVLTLQRTGHTETVPRPRSAADIPRDVRAAVVRDHLGDGPGEAAVVSMARARKPCEASVLSSYRSSTLATCLPSSMHTWMCCQASRRALDLYTSRCRSSAARFRT